MAFAGIALIGLRGAGKSTLGKMLAKKIGWRFVELNKEIEAQNGLSVAEIIALYGQEGFRRMEQAALGQLLARRELTVLATGGGIVSEPLTFDLILSSFYTIWLKAEPEEHMARVRRQGDLRPMADDRSAMAELATSCSAANRSMPAPPPWSTPPVFRSTRPRRAWSMRWRRCCKVTRRRSACAAQRPDPLPGPRNPLASNGRASNLIPRRIRPRPTRKGSSP